MNINSFTFSHGGPSTGQINQISSNERLRQDISNLEKRYDRQESNLLTMLNTMMEIKELVLISLRTQTKTSEDVSIQVPKDFNSIMGFVNSELTKKARKILTPLLEDLRYLLK